MLLFNQKVLVKAARKHRDAAIALAQWEQVAAAAGWQNLAELRRSFASADGVAVKVKGFGVVIATVFNIKGNEYRLITIVNYAEQSIVVREFLTHAQYSSGLWKERL